MSIKTKVNEETGSFEFSQDTREVEKYTELRRIEAKSQSASSRTNYRSFAVIPDIVSVAIMLKHNIDINSPDITQAEMSKFRSIIKKDYPLLLTGSTSHLPKGI